MQLAKLGAVKMHRSKRIFLRDALLVVDKTENTVMSRDV